MNALRVKVSDGGRVVIPAEYRQALGIQVGDDVILTIEGRTVELRTIDEAIRRAQELVSKYIPADRALTDELIAERRTEAANE